MGVPKFLVYLYIRRSKLYRCNRQKEEMALREEHDQVWYKITRPFEFSHVYYQRPSTARQRDSNDPPLGYRTRQGGISEAIIDTVLRDRSVILDICFSCAPRTNISREERTTCAYTSSIAGERSALHDGCRAYIKEVDGRYSF